eukprot:TRINITY_DN2243_c2_g1_i2.p1 TRINITY_DN2243_c2_g1~~TRINITY_DN2243_c2_g1_i2.p1  ORF type:complete len:499 (-),score=193.81 TRINITY_DN2243_c2_g1_i2:146-1450(-)
MSRAHHSRSRPPVSASELWAIQLGLSLGHDKFVTACGESIDLGAHGRTNVEGELLDRIRQLEDEVRKCRTSQGVLADRLVDKAAEAKHLKFALEVEKERCRELRAMAPKAALSDTQDRAVRAQERRKRLQAERLMSAYKGLYEEQMRAVAGEGQRYRTLVRSYSKLSAENRGLRAQLAEARSSGRAQQQQQQRPALLQQPPQQQQQQQGGVEMGGVELAPLPPLLAPHSPQQQQQRSSCSSSGSLHEASVATNIEPWSAADERNAQEQQQQQHVPGFEQPPSPSPPPQQQRRQQTEVTTAAPLSPQQQQQRAPRYGRSSSAHDDSMATHVEAWRADCDVTVRTDDGEDEHCCSDLSALHDSVLEAELLRVSTAAVPCEGGALATLALPKRCASPTLSTPIGWSLDDDVEEEVEVGDEDGVALGVRAGDERQSCP